MSTWSRTRLFAVDLEEGPPEGRFEKVAYGFALPWALLRAVQADELLGVAYRRAVRRQWLVVGVLSIAFSWGSLSGIDANKHADGLLLIAAAVWGTVKLADWLVAAFAREHDDALVHLVSARFGAVPEPTIERPRIRFSLRWALKRLRRKATGAAVIALAAPVVGLVAWLPGGDFLRAVLTGVWALYWVAVFTTSKSSVAWNDARQSGPAGLVVHARVSAAAAACVEVTARAV